MASNTLPPEGPANCDPDRVLVHIDVAEAPDALLSLGSDVPDQAETILYSDRPEDDDEIKEATVAFSLQKHATRSLEDMKRIYDLKQRDVGLDLLKKRLKVPWRKSDLVLYPSKLGDEVDWKADHSFIDLFVAVSRGIGLGALLPNVTSDMSWKFHLEVSKHSSRDFGLANVKLGFDPLERILWVGKTAASEDVWIAMVPHTFATDDIPALEELKVAGKRRTHLKDHHRYILLAFLAKMLERIGMRGIYMDTTYPDLDDDGFNQHSNL
jgi:hypothetical protein